MKRALFITGTDTGVGKTFTASLIASSLKAKGIDVGVMKPIETGCAVRNKNLIPEDALSLMQAAGSIDPLDDVNPYRFTAALSPHLAARLEGVEVDLDKIKTQFEKLSRSHDIILVEGAGGLLVPITETKITADLVLALGIPVVIVAASRLGVINHTLLTVEAARRRNIEVKGIILNNVTPAAIDLSRKYNLKEIKALTGLPVFELPYAEKKEAPFLTEEGLLKSLGLF